jgi:hypothetical protein
MRANFNGLRKTFDPRVCAPCIMFKYSSVEADVRLVMHLMRRFRFGLAARGGFERRLLAHADAFTGANWAD